MLRFRLSLLTLVLLAAGCEREIIRGIEKPPCAKPAPLEGQMPVDAPGYIVGFHPNTPAQATTERLAQKYGFTPTYVYATLPGFAARMSGNAVAALRCEPEVRYVEHSSVVFVGT